jgi:lipopolysaccharide export LptBFGC system permease protein LptF
MTMPSLPKWLWWLAIPVVALLLVIVIAAFFLDEPLRAYAEREMNQRLPA